MALIGVHDDHKGRFIDVNAGWASLLGFATAELIGEPAAESLLEGDQLRWFAELDRLSTGKVDRIYQINRYVMRHGKEIVTLRVWAWRIRSNDGATTAVLAHARCVPECETDKLKAEHDKVIHQIDILAARIEAIERRDNSVEVYTGDHVGRDKSTTGDVTKNDLGPFKWLVIGLIALILGVVWVAYYQHGGTEPPPSPAEIQQSTEGV